jgi:hypothetical protein
MTGTFKQNIATTYPTIFIERGTNSTELMPKITQKSTAPWPQLDPKITQKSTANSWA